jgi:uncharacterized Zn-binding protein involved in type VI secretion
MPKAARLGDIGAGHACFPPTPIIAGSGDVSINGRSAARKGDALLLHGCGNCPPHGRSISAGSGTVSINGKCAARASDGIGCGGSISAGSGDVLIGNVGMGGPLKSCMEGARESASAFVKVDFEAFPVPENQTKLMEFTMAAYAGPEALIAQVKGQAQALIGAKLQSLQSAAFGPALSSLGIDPTNLSLDKLKSLASGAGLQNALITQVTQAAGGLLVAHLSQIILPVLAQDLVAQVTSAMKSGRVTPEMLKGSVLSGTDGKLSTADSPGTVLSTVAQRTISKEITPDAAAIALQPSLSPITDKAAQAAVKKFVG